MERLLAGHRCFWVGVGPGGYDILGDFKHSRFSGFSTAGVDLFVDLLELL